jgi:predicted DNA-binding antitoxin AbrB/MazE fold protein
MQMILEATYRDGVLVPDRSLGPEKEGKKFKLIVVEEKEFDAKRDQFLQFVRDHRFSLPEGYRFNRDEIYER